MDVEEYNELLMFMTGGSYPESLRGLGRILVNKRHHYKKKADNFYMKDPLVSKLIEFYIDGKNHFNMNECVKRLCTVGSEAGSSKKLKRAEELTSPFAIGGKCEDEVKLVFGDKKELYVSKNFLILSSPVFEAMFRNDFTEKKNNLVKLPGKKYEDFLEFLDCINPGSLQDVNEGNVLRILPIAEEYQVNSAVLMCKAIIRNIVLSLKKELPKSVYHFVSSGSYEKQLKSLRRCLNVLSTAICISYQDFIGQCIGIAACYSTGLYTQTRLVIPENTLQSECKELFEKLPAEIRCQILSKRLFSCENTNVYAYSGE